jgi:hypothetical protein
MPAQNTSKGCTVYWVTAESDGEHVMEGVVEESSGSVVKVRAVREWWSGGNARVHDAKPVNMGTLFFEESLEELLRDDPGLWQTILNVFKNR